MAVLFFILVLFDSLSLVCSVGFRQDDVLGVF